MRRLGAVRVVVRRRQVSSGQTQASARARRRGWGCWDSGCDATNFDDGCSSHVRPFGAISRDVRRRECKAVRQRPPLEGDPAQWAQVEQQTRDARMKRNTWSGRSSAIENSYLRGDRRERGTPTLVAANVEIEFNRFFFLRCTSACERQAGIWGAGPQARRNLSAPPNRVAFDAHIFFFLFYFFFFFLCFLFIFSISLWFLSLFHLLAVTH